jgi:large subunit ribosomal protein L4
MRKRRFWKLQNAGHLNPDALDYRQVFFCHAEPATGKRHPQLAGTAMQIQVHNEAGEVVGSVELDEKLLGEKVRRKLMHQAVIRYEANKRVGTHKTKSKAERSGSGVKPFKQKHTGRARAGLKRSPLWKGGGNVFGPVMRDYHKGMPVRMRREALKSALLSKALDNQLYVIDTLNFEKPKTKRFTDALGKLGIADKSCLVAPLTPGVNLVKSVRNLEKCRIIPARNLNAYDILKHKNLLVTRETIEKLTEVVKS